MNTLTLSKQMHVTHKFILNIAIKVFKLKPDNSGMCELDGYTSNIIRSMCKHEFMNDFKTEAKQSMSKSFIQESESVTFDQWVNGKDLSGLSTVEIGEMANLNTYINLKQISRLMRANGYKSKVVYLGNDKQGRRWFKVVDTADNIKAAKEKAKQLSKPEVSFI